MTILEFYCQTALGLTHLTVPEQGHPRSSRLSARACTEYCHHLAVASVAAELFGRLTTETEFE
jgi:hypothetical protein